MADWPNILIIDDDDRLSSLLKRYLQGQDFLVTTTKNAAEARQILAVLDFDLLVIDVMMPGETGIEFARSWRSHSSVPMLLLTALGEASDRIAGLETGVDDYMAKPYEPRELVLRIQSILRRSRVPMTDGRRVEIPTERYDFGDYSYDRTKKTLACGERVVRLTTAESSLLVWLVDHLGQPQSREILRSVIEGSVLDGSGTEAGGEEERSTEDLVVSPTRAVDVHVTRLRRKLEADPKLPRYLQTVWGKGYLLQSD